jgi:hypothetical protein
MAVGGLPFDPSLLLGFGEPWDQSKVGAIRFFFSVSAEPVARWLPGTDAGPCGDPHVLRRSDQAEPGT